MTTPRFLSSLPLAFPLAASRSIFHTTPVSPGHTASSAFADRADLPLPLLPCAFQHIRQRFLLHFRLLACNFALLRYFSRTPVRERGPFSTLVPLDLVQADLPAEAR